jgi:hypothetical protein
VDDDVMTDEDLEKALEDLSLYADADVSLSLNSPKQEIVPLGQKDTCAAYERESDNHMGRSRADPC